MCLVLIGGVGINLTQCGVHARVQWQRSHKLGIRIQQFECLSEKTTNGASLAPFAVCSFSPDPVSQQKRNEHLSLPSSNARRGASTQ